MTHMICPKHKVNMKKHGVPGSRYCYECHKPRGKVKTEIPWEKQHQMNTGRNKFLKKKHCRWDEHGNFIGKSRPSKKARRKGK